LNRRPRGIARCVVSRPGIADELEPRLRCPRRTHGRHRFQIRGAELGCAPRGLRNAIDIRKLAHLVDGTRRGATRGERNATRAGISHPWSRRHGSRRGRWRRRSDASKGHGGERASRGKRRRIAPRGEHHLDVTQRYRLGLARGRRSKPLRLEARSARIVGRRGHDVIEVELHRWPARWPRGGNGLGPRKQRGRLGGWGRIDAKRLALFTCLAHERASVRATRRVARFDDGLADRAGEPHKAE
jgi:hypothetical protein